MDFVMRIDYSRGAPSSVTIEDADPVKAMKHFTDLVELADGQGLDAIVGITITAK